MARGSINNNQSSDKPKTVFTTGEVARICSVAPRTVSKWFDSGQLRGYRIPGSRDRRIPLAELMRFMKAHGMPVEALETGHVRVLLLDSDQQFVELLTKTLQELGLEVCTASGEFQAGILANQFRPQILIIDTMVQGLDPQRIAHQVRSDPYLRHTRLIAVGAQLDSGRGQALKEAGFDAYLAKPFEVQKLVDLLENNHYQR